MMDADTMEVSTVCVWFVHLTVNSHKDSQRCEIFTMLCVVWTVYVTYKSVNNFALK